VSQRVSKQYVVATPQREILHVIIKMNAFRMSCNIYIALCVLIFSTGYSFVLSRIVSRIKRRAESGEALASRFAVLAVYEKMSYRMSFGFAITAVVVASIGMVTLSAGTDTAQSVSFSFCCMLSAAYGPLHSCFSVWYKWSGPCIVCILLIWFGMGVIIFIFDADCLLWWAAVFFPGVILGAVRLYTSLNHDPTKHCHPSMIYSVSVWFAYCVTLECYLLLIWSHDASSSWAALLLAQALLQLSAPTAVVHDARLETARWKRVGKTSATAIYDESTSFDASSVSCALLPVSLLQWVRGCWTARGQEAADHHSAVARRTDFPRRMYNANKFMLDFSVISLQRQLHYGDESEQGVVHLGSFRGSKQVAVTVFSGDRAQRMVSESDEAEGGLAFLKAEVLLYDALRNPLVLQVLGICICPPELMLLSEHCERGSLSESLRRDHEEWTNQRRLAVCSDMCNAVSLAHGMGVAHGNLSTCCFMLTGDWQVKLAGFRVPLHLPGVLAEEQRRAPQVLRPYLAAPAAYGCYSQSRDVCMAEDVRCLGRALLEVWTGGKLCCGGLCELPQHHQDDGTYVDGDDGGGVCSICDGVLIQWLMSTADRNCFHSSHCRLEWGKVDYSSRFCGGSRQQHTHACRSSLEAVELRRFLCCLHNSLRELILVCLCGRFEQGLASPKESESLAAGLFRLLSSELSVASQRHQDPPSPLIVSSPRPAAEATPPSSSKHLPLPTGARRSSRAGARLQYSPQFSPAVHQAVRPPLADEEGAEEGGAPDFQLDDFYPLSELELEERASEGRQIWGIEGMTTSMLRVLLERSLSPLDVLCTLPSSTWQSSAGAKKAKMSQGTHTLSSEGDWTVRDESWEQQHNSCQLSKDNSIL
jgi:hypothetical protein